MKNKIKIEDIYFNDKIIKPSEINQNIIDSIPNINFRGFSKEQSELLVSVIKKTLERVKENNEARELALVYDLNMICNQFGDWLFEVRGDTDTDIIKLGSNSDVMHLLNDFEQKHIIVISHNHPNNRIISLVDLQALTESDNINTIVAVTNSGKISYITKINFNYEKFQIFKSKFVNEAKKLKLNDSERLDFYLVSLINNAEQYGLYFEKED